MQSDIAEIKYEYDVVKPIFGDQFCDIVLPLIENAKNEINIIVFNWRMPFDTPKLSIRAFNDSLVRAIGRGVKVRAIVSKPFVAEELHRFGIIAKVMPSSRRLHTKLLIIDKQKIIVGSHNYSQSAFAKNFECSVYFALSEAENKFINYFENLWSF